MAARSPEPAVVAWFAVLAESAVRAEFAVPALPAVPARSAVWALSARFDEDADGTVPRLARSRSVPLSEPSLTFAPVTAFFFNCGVPTLFLASLVTA